jgi:uncharacterized membrane protein
VLHRSCPLARLPAEVRKRPRPRLVAVQPRRLQLRRLSARGPTLHRSAARYRDRLAGCGVLLLMDFILILVGLVLTVAGVALVARNRNRVESWQRPSGLGWSTNSQGFLVFIGLTAAVGGFLLVVLSIVSAAGG